MKEFNLRLTENEIMTLVYVLNNQESHYFQFLKGTIYYDELSEKIKNQALESLDE